MKKLPKFLFAMIFSLVFAVVLLPEIKEDLSGLSAEAATQLTTSVAVTSQKESSNPPPQIEEDISEIRIPDKTIIACIDGYWDLLCNECPYGYCTHQYFIYNITPEEITLVFKDGTEITCTYEEARESTGCRIEYLNNSDFQSFENQWDTGEHTVSVRFGNAETSYKVNIISPVEALTLLPTITR